MTMCTNNLGPKYYKVQTHGIPTLRRTLIFMPKSKREYGTLVTGWREHNFTRSKSNSKLDKGNHILGDLG